jgi:hypothetical protein
MGNDICLGKTGPGGANIDRNNIRDRTVCRPGTNDEASRATKIRCFATADAWRMAHNSSKQFANREIISRNRSGGNLKRNPLGNSSNDLSSYACKYGHKQQQNKDARPSEPPAQ